jgi:hypothetical protein
VVSVVSVEYVGFMESRPFKRELHCDDTEFDTEFSCIYYY